MIMIILAVWSVLECAHGTNYCTLNCTPRIPHVMCEYKSVPGVTCYQYKHNPLTQKEKESIVFLHNELRRNISHGREERGLKGSQPPAANMMQLKWSKELERIAKRWAGQCQRINDKCRRTEEYVYVGQNINCFQEGVSKGDLLDHGAMIYQWYNQVVNVNPIIIPSYPWGQRKIEKYSQIVWATTKYIGCGRSQYLMNKKNASLLVCNYAPKGNRAGRSVYTVGKACSWCPNDTICIDGLCAESVSPGSNKWLLLLIVVCLLTA